MFIRKLEQVHSHSGETVDAELELPPAAHGWCCSPTARAIGSSPRCFSELAVLAGAGARFAEPGALGRVAERARGWFELYLDAGRFLGGHL